MSGRSSEGHATCPRRNHARCCADTSGGFRPQSFFPSTTIAAVVAPLGLGTGLGRWRPVHALQLTVCCVPSPLSTPSRASRALRPCHRRPRFQHIPYMAPQWGTRVGFHHRAHTPIQSRPCLQKARVGRLCWGCREAALEVCPSPLPAACNPSRYLSWRAQPSGACS